MAAAALVGCNNESIVGPEVVTPDLPGGIKETTNTETYMSLSLPIKADQTYAGTGEEFAYPVEEQVSTAYVFVYRYNGTATPQAYAYKQGFATTDKIVMKVTDGTKKIYVAVNAGLGGKFLAEPSSLGLALSSNVDNDSLKISTPETLNPIYWTTGADYGTAAPTHGSANQIKADGLIKALAGGALDHSKGAIFASGTSYSAYASTYPANVFGNDTRFLMSNWDNSGNDKAGSSEYISTCTFTLTPNVSQTQAQNGMIPTSDKNDDGTANNVLINIQRAVAKAAVMVNMTPVSGKTNNWFEATDKDGNKLTDGSGGYFEAWADANNAPIWVLGNINKEATVFQKFVNGAVTDDNYDSIKLTNNDWYVNFDNTRVYGTATAHGSYTTSLVETTMKTAGNNLPVGQHNFAYVTENAQSFASGWEANSTYMVIGGKYHPEFWVSDVQLAPIASAAPFIGYNGVALKNDSVIKVGGKDSIINNQYGTPFEEITYVPTSGNDTLYYHTQWKVFFHGKDNVAKYYAWVKGTSTDRETIADPLNDPDIIDKINNDMHPAVGSPILVGYDQGRCFYRAFFYEINAPIMEERVLIRRNHIYEMTVNHILGPGIANPNNIIMDDVPVLESDTYLAVNVKVVKWHKVTQNMDLSGRE